MTDTTTTRLRVRQWQDPAPPDDQADALEWEHANGLPTTGDASADVVTLGRITDHDTAPACAPSAVGPSPRRPAAAARLRSTVGWSVALALVAQCTVSLAIWTGRADNPLTLVLSASLAVCCVLLVSAEYLTRRQAR